MHRDPRLRDLSPDHHQGLVLARRIRRAFEARIAGADPVEEVRRRYENELRPHFEVEETFLLPELSSAGFTELARRTLREHQTLRAHLEAAGQGHVDRVRKFGALLEAHIRFEEHELFPTCEKHLDSEALEAVAAKTRGQASCPLMR